MSKSAYAAVIAATVVSSSAFSQVTYVDQLRSVRVQGGFNGPQTTSSTTLGEWHELQELEDPTFHALGRATFDSTALAPGGFHVTASGFAQRAELQPPQGRTRSVLDVTFTVSTPTPYSLSGSVYSLFSPGSVNAMETSVDFFDGVSAVHHYLWDFSTPTSNAFNLSGTLLPGHSYRFRIAAETMAGSGFPPTSDCGFEATLVAPTPGSAGSLGLAALAFACRRRRA